LNELVLRFEEETKRAGLQISVKKTKMLVTDVEGHETQKTEIRLKRGESVEVVENVSDFIYLGSLLDKSGTSSKEIERRLMLGAWKFGQLQKPLWNQPSVSLETKLKIYRTVVLSTVLYGCETWACSEADFPHKETLKINTFHTKKLRFLVGKKRDEISNAELFKLTTSWELENIVSKYRLRWAGHVRRMDCARLPKRVLFGSLVKPADIPWGNKRGRPKKDWTSCLKDDCERVGLKWPAEATDRAKWLKRIESLTPSYRKK
jgi:hypothetical protein